MNRKNKSKQEWLREQQQENQEVRTKRTDELKSGMPYSILHIDMY